MELPVTTAGELGRLVVIITAVAAAAFGILFSKLRLSRFRRRRSSVVRLPSFCSSSDEDNDDDDASTSSTGDGEETAEMEDRDDKDEEEEEDDDEGSGDLSYSSFSLADLVEGMGVVKAWDGMGLGFDERRGDILRSFNGRSAQIITEATLAWQEITDRRRGAVVRVWDER